MSAPDHPAAGQADRHAPHLPKEKAVTLPHPPAHPAPPTLADVALLAGVSCATASRVLTGSARVRPHTRDKVEQAITQLGYARHRAPRTPHPHHTGSIALVVCEQTVKFFADPFFARLLWGITKTLTTTGLQPVLLTLYSPHDYHTLTRYLRSGHVDGALIISLHAHPSIDLTSLGLPLVLCGRPTTSAEHLTYVDADNLHGAQQAVHHLIHTGRQHIATIAGPPDMSPGIDRLAGYRTALTTTTGPPDPAMIAYGDFTRRSGEHALHRLIDHRPSLDALFVASDLMATGALHALHRLGRRVPDDVAVIGFDDLPLSQHTHPTLSTVRQPVDTIGTHMVHELLAQLTTKNRPPNHVILPTQLILRQST